MKRMIFVSAAAGLACLAMTLKAQESKSDDPSPVKVLAMEDGVWDAEVTVTMPGPDGKVTPATSRAVETNRMLAGKWLISDVKGEFFDSPFEGHGQYGYDVKKGKYVATWIDSMSTHIDFMEGTYDAKTKTLTFRADSENPADGKPMKMRLETQFNDDGTRVVSEFVQMGGQKEFAKFMVIKYTKRKA
jgi:uncharacterized protein DUF1579